MTSHSAIRARLFLRRCRYGFAVMAAWFAFGAVGYRWIEGLGWSEALRDALYLGVPHGTFWDLYSFWGQCVLFGIVISVFVLQALQEYNPEEASRMLAKEMTDHAIVVGYTHLGGRIVDKFRAEGKPYVLIEKDGTAVDHLIRQGQPVIVDNAKEESTLLEAGIERAGLLVVASNNVETALLVTKRAREKNKKMRIVVRCYVDEFAEILESLGANAVISSSQSAFKELSPHLELTA